MTQNSMEFYNPVRIVSGIGCFKGFDGISAYGKKAMIVCGAHSAEICGALADAKALFERCGIDYTVFDKITPNPLVAVCREGGAAAREFHAEFVLGIGGGSPMDAAKAIATFATNPELTDDSIFTVKLPNRTRALPILLVNTTAGTGSEVTPYSVLTYPAVENKKTFSDADSFAQIAFLDPVYTYSLDMRFTVSTAVDALSHIAEGSLSNLANDFTDALAIRAAGMLADGLRAVKQNGLDCDVRASLLYASTMAGQVISRTGTGFVHAMGYPLTYHHGMPHGEANALFLGDFLKYMANGASTRVNMLLAAANVPDIAAFEGLYVSLMNLSYEADDQALRAYAVTASAARGIKFGAVNASISDLYNIYADNKFRKRSVPILTSRFDPATATSAHQGTMLCSPVLPDGTPAPFEHAWGYRDKAGRTEYHQHDKEEIYILMRGEGVMIIDGAEKAVKAGDVIYIPPNAFHSLVNPEDKPMLWAGMWWPRRS